MAHKPVGADQLMVDEELRLVLVALGYWFFSESDSEVVPKAFHSWGGHCVSPTKPVSS